ncbi:MAG TPA: hypothetical protein PKL88_01895 [bacterium]|nr:hypothetical protein [bacterium]
MSKQNILKNFKSKWLLVVPLFFFSIFIGLSLKQNLEMKKNLSDCEKPCVCPEANIGGLENKNQESKQLEEAKKMGLITKIRTANIDSWIKISGGLPNNITYSFKYPGNLFVKSSSESGTNYYNFWKNKESYEKDISCRVERKNREEEGETFGIEDEYPCWNIFKENMLFGLAVYPKVMYSYTYKTSDTVIYDGLQGSHNFKWVVPKDIESGVLGGYVFNYLYALGESSLGTKVDIAFNYFTDDSERVISFTELDPYLLFLHILSTFEFYQQ